MHINQFKTQFNQNSPYIHLNNSGQAPIPDVNRLKVKEWVDRFYYEAAFCSMEGWAQVEVTRKEFAKFINADIEEISFFQTTASAISQAAFSIPLLAEDEILTWDQEYPSNFYPWRQAAQRAGAKVIQIDSINFETPVEKILEKVNSKTRVIAISWIQYLTGAETDLKKLSDAVKGKNIWLVADVIQGLGVRPFDFKDCGFDIICGGSHKWMCSSYGGSFMVVKKDKLEHLQPREYGAMTYGDPDTTKSFTIQTKKSAIKFEPGSKAMVEIIAMAESIKLFQSVGINNIFAEASRLGQKLRTGLVDLGYKVFYPQIGPIINFAGKNSQTNEVLAETLKRNKISYALRGPGIRLSAHAFNLDEEITKTLKVISEVK